MGTKLVRIDDATWVALKTMALERRTTIGGLLRSLAGVAGESSPGHGARLKKAAKRIKGSAAAVPAAVESLPSAVDEWSAACRRCGHTKRQHLVGGTVGRCQYPSGCGCPDFQAET